MLSGLMGIGDTMFQSLGEPNKYKLMPDPEEMKRRMDEAQHVRRAELKCVETRTYDLSDTTQTLQYCKDREYLLVGMAMNTHMLLNYDKQFVATASPPRWMAHMEWAEFELKQTDVPPIRSAEEQEHAT